MSPLPCPAPNHELSSLSGEIVEETHHLLSPEQSCPVFIHQMEPSARAPFTEITQHLEQILEQLPEPTPLAKMPLAKAPLTYNQGT